MNNAMFGKSTEDVQKPSHGVDQAQVFVPGVVMSKPIHIGAAILDKYKQRVYMHI